MEEMGCDQMGRDEINGANWGVPNMEIMGCDQMARDEMGCGTWEDYGQV